MMVKYDLKFRQKGQPWRLFDSYESLDDPQLKIYFNSLGWLKFNDGVKVVKVETTRTDIDFKQTKAL